MSNVLAVDHVSSGNDCKERIDAGRCNNKNNIKGRVLHTYSFTHSLGQMTKMDVVQFSNPLKAWNSAAKYA